MIQGLSPQGHTPELRPWSSLQYPNPFQITEPVLFLSETKSTSSNLHLMSLKLLGHSLCSFFIAAFLHAPALGEFTG